MSKRSRELESSPTARVIKFWKAEGSYAALSNFYTAESFSFDCDGQTYASAEHLYHALRYVWRSGGASAVDKQFAEEIRRASTPYKAKLLSHLIGDLPANAPGWQHQLAGVVTGYRARGLTALVETPEQRERAMLFALDAKFRKCPRAQAVLFSTLDASLEEHSPDDAFWGVGAHGRGENRLGVLLMDVRRALRDARVPAVAIPPPFSGAAPIGETLIKKVISGGQTGADLAALEAARECNVPTGGHAVQGFLTLNGPNLQLKTLFGLVDDVSLRKGNGAVAQAYTERSRLNVDDSDGTVAFRTRSSIGTDKTALFCRSGVWPQGPLGLQPLAQLWDPTSAAPWYRPCLLIDDLSVEKIDSNAEKIVEFVQKKKIKCLNVCGHRDAATAGVENFNARVKEILVKAFTLLNSFAFSFSSATTTTTTTANERAKIPPIVVRLRRKVNGVVEQDCDVYVGRACTQGGWNLPTSDWANPFSLKESGNDRTLCLARYEEYLRTRRPDLIARIVAELGGGKRLGCWCSPEKCHADVLVKLFKELIATQ
jgi:predicted NAD-dependent protein-ADP-ribosyltransferase YbiA (DUF1768 family)